MDDLLAAARAAATHAYAPYSHFPVGAALRLADGRILTAANVENASYGLSLCAEAVACARAANEGALGEIVAVAVAGPASAEPVTPCGRCRQMLAEAAQLGGRDLPITCAGAPDAPVRQHLLSALLPHAFGPASLGDLPGAAGRPKERHGDHARQLDSRPRAD